jgi:hypothetical protein
VTKEVREELEVITFYILMRMKRRKIAKGIIKCDKCGNYEFLKIRKV